MDLGLLLGGAERAFAHSIEAFVDRTVGSSTKRQKLRTIKLESKVARKVEVGHLSLPVSALNPRQFKVIDK